MKQARIRISDELLLHCLSLPADTKILHAGHLTPCVVELIVEHKDLPDAPHPGLPPLASPTFERKDDKPVFLGWGI